MHWLASVTPKRALRLSLAVALATGALKAIAWWLTGSVGFMSDALESLVNVAGASFALAMVGYAGKPADDDHQFGHGKAEYFAAAFEGAMIFGAALAIMVAAGQRLLEPKPVETLGIGTLLAVLASIANLGTARLLSRMARVHRSPALDADARHLMTDVWTTAGVIVGVTLAISTGWLWLDPVVAMVVALNILREGWRLLGASAGGLMDQTLEPDETRALAAMLSDFESRGCRFGTLRTRAAGTQRFAEVIVLVPGKWTVDSGHALADEIEVGARALGIELTTHVEPLVS